ncbi:MAG: DUF389 domain-containing protein [Xenococcus sp. MO_188.B8]|nr:DUF389 domain-containing protein [Xenococcus sp. MO_188.B8]
MRLSISKVKLYLSNIWRNFTADWSILLEKPTPHVELNDAFERASIPSFGFYFMLSLSTIIATLGLLLNSAATIIGAMIIAPLMNPIITLSYALVASKPKLLKRSCLTLLSGIVVTIIISFFTTNYIGIRVVQSEIIARINPNLGDLVVGLAAGAAASFAYTRRSISTALPGVAIAVALVPPLSVVGIGLFVGEKVTPAIGMSIGGNILWDGALLLFLTNLVAIVFAASLVFLLQAYGNWQRAILGLFLSLIALFLISLPLGFSFNEVILRAQVRNYMAVVSHREFNDLIDQGASLRSINVETGEDGALNIDVFLFAPRNSIFQRDVKLMQEFLSETMKRPVNIKLRVIPFDILEFEVLDPEVQQPK